MGGQRRRNLAALDANTGRVTGWDPSPNNEVVYALAAGKGLIYAAGNFTIIGGEPRSAIAALDATSGAATNWNPNADEIVRSIAVSGNTIYVGGGFTHIGGQARNYIAALDAATGLSTPWNPSSNDWVLTLVSAGATVYAGGFFGHIGGATREAVAALDANTGTATGWNANADPFAVISALAFHGNTLYAGGFISSIGGQNRTQVAALDATTGLATGWNPSLSGALQGPEPVVHALAADANAVYIGGDFYSVGGKVRKAIAAVDVLTGAPLDWDAGADNIVWSVMASADRVYAGGVFHSMSSLPRSCFSAVTAPDAAIAMRPRQALPDELRLDQNYPNPVRLKTSVRFALPLASAVTLEVFDLQGRRLAAPLDHEPQAAGPHEVEIATAGWASGTYLYRLDAGGARTTRKMLVLK
jgi:hypothetical protein